MNGEYAALAGRIREELIETKRVADRAGTLMAKAQRTGDDGYLDGVALNLHGFYAGIERILESIAREVEGSVPSGSGWHHDLLIQMSAEVSGARPAVISRDTRYCLDDYRGFRHVVRNVYTFNLRPSRLQELVTGVQTCYTAVRRDLELFADFLDSLTQAQRSRETEAYGEQEE